MLTDIHPLLKVLRKLTFSRLTYMELTRGIISCNMNLVVTQERKDIVTWVETTCKRGRKMQSTPALFLPALFLH